MCKRKVTRVMNGLIISILSTLSSISTAHTVWLEPTKEENIYNVVFGGHAGKLVSYKPEKMKQVQAFDAVGNDLSFKRFDQSESSQLHLLPGTALVAIYFNNGTWSKDRMGKSINKSMDEVPFANRATKAVKYHKTVLQWTPVVLQTLGQDFEVVPLDSIQPKAGQPMAVKVLLKGKPLAGVKLGHSEIGDAAVTNAQGLAEFIPKRGFNKLWAGKRFQVDAEKYTELSYEYLFGFYAE